MLVRPTRSRLPEQLTLKSLPRVHGMSSTSTVYSDCEDCLSVRPPNATVVLPPWMSPWLSRWAPMTPQSTTPDDPWRVLRGAALRRTSPADLAPDQWIIKMVFANLAN
jgi:hypothetical protein